MRGDDGVLRGFFNTCRHRAHELMPCGATDDQRSIQCPYHGWRYGLDGALLSTPHFEAPDGFDRTLHGLTPVAVEEWHGWAMVDVSGSAPPLQPLRRRSRGPGRTVRARTTGGRRHPFVRDRRQLEAGRRELPGVLPLPAHPSRAVRREPRRERREPRRPRRDVDRRVAGPATPRRHDVAHGRQRRGDAPRPRRASPGAASTTSACCPTCSSACTPTT